MATEKYNHFEYGERLATQHKLIQHTKDKKRFFRYSEPAYVSDLFDSMSSISGIVLIAYNNYTAHFTSNDMDSLMKRPEYAFWIVKGCKSDNTETYFAALKECETIAEQIISRMLKDSRTINGALHLLDRNSFKIEAIGPLGDNFCGVELSFFFDQGVNFQFDKSIWEE